MIEDVIGASSTGWIRATWASTAGWTTTNADPDHRGRIQANLPNPGDLPGLRTHPAEA